MEPTENPYVSPQTTAQQSTPPSKSIFNLDAAALALLIVSSVELLLFGPLAAALFFGATISGTFSIQSPFSKAALIAVCSRSVLVMISTLCMHKRRLYAFALTGAILSCLGIVFAPTAFTVPFGLWALIVLLHKETRAAFAEAN